jgi:hypothetical protein
MRPVTPEGGLGASESGFSPLLSDDIGSLELQYSPTAALDGRYRRTDAPPPRRHVIRKSQSVALTRPVML